MAKEYIEKVFAKFEDHLYLPNNNRIIFSGKFGIGKSYFLNEFFKDGKYENEYFPIFLNPVNYSVSNNQDIFELIKFDILFQILDKNIVDFDNFDFPTGNLVYQYFSNKFLNDFISNVDLLGETIIEEQLPKSYSILKNIGKLISKISEVNKDDFNSFKQEIESNPDLKIIKRFFDEEEIKIGSIYENNAVSQLIYKLIKSIETKTEKETVLIIDDLDRIDPEHIFRILNIFSAHDRENENKFGFEKIVLVCDIKNIKSIYHHFYGEETDFFGYINKFYSLEIYNYSNQDYVKWFEENFVSDSFSNNEHLEFIKFIIAKGISENVISARQLFNLDFSKKGINKHFNSIWNRNSQVVYKNKKIFNFHNYIEGFAIISTLLKYFGNQKLFLQFIIKEETQNFTYFKKTFLSLYEFLIFYKERNEDEGHSFRDEDLNVTYQITNGIVEFKSIQNLEVEKFYENLIKKHNEIIN